MTEKTYICPRCGVIVDMVWMGESESPHHVGYSCPECKLLYPKEEIEALNGGQ
jgi:DNA-directed RNA polymerase subunit RPC12/RpoP